MTGRRLRVALIVETSNAYGRGLLEGIIDHIRAHEAWSVFLPEQSRGASPPAWLRRWDGDGVIARIENAEVAACVRDAGVPTVDVSAGRFLPDLPWVETDDRAIAQTAVAHFVERGFRSLAFCGDPRFNWSRWRGEHMAAFAAAHKCTFATFDLRNSKDWESEQKRLGAWVDGLPRPTGILGCYDVVAQRVLDACRGKEIAVPEEIAVLGVDDDQVLCRLSDPPLSSIVPDTRRAGQTAATMLSMLMAKKPLSERSVLVPPKGVATRQSTDVLAIDDRHVAEALRFIRENQGRGITVADVLAQSRLSRRVLEARFRKVVGRSPHDELLRVRLAQVKILLAETELSVAEIADRMGYVHVEYLSAQFRREVGIAPSAYRQAHRRGSTP